MAAVENPIDGIAGKDIGDLLFGGQDNQCRLEQARTHLRWRLCFGDHDRARRAGLE
jgi:hypothetical protein